VRLSELAKRPKNKHIDEAYKKMEEMKDWPADACSGLWYDQDNKLLVAYIANHISVSILINSLQVIYNLDNLIPRHLTQSMSMSM
jgi:hypothetical protein